MTFRSAQLETIQALVCSGVDISLVLAMATRSERADLPEYRSVLGPKPVAVWPKQRPIGRAASEFLKQVSARSKELKR
jgi:LysR family transcriptional regulator, hydrogen peroxide-inducible genes activator